MKSVAWLLADLLAVATLIYVVAGLQDGQWLRHDPQSSVVIHLPEAGQ